MDLEGITIPRIGAEEMMKLAEVDQGFGSSLTAFGELMQVAETDPIANRFFIELYPNFKAFFGTPVWVRGEAVAVLSMVDIVTRHNWTTRKLELEGWARKVSVILEAGASADIADVLPLDFPSERQTTRETADSEGSKQQRKISGTSTCSTLGLHDELHALTHSQLSAVTAGASPSYLAALSRMAKRQLSDIVLRLHSLEEEEAAALRHSLDIAHLRHLADLGNSDDHIIQALENIAAFQRDAVSRLSRVKVDEKMSKKQVSNTLAL